MLATVFISGRILVRDVVGYRDIAGVWKCLIVNGAFPEIISDSIRIPNVSAPLDQIPNPYSL